jgi:2-keto-3-deoxy-L-rhamnonate aldolase RhmA
MQNTTKRKLKEGKAVIGSAVSIDDPFALRAMAGAGFDFLMIDTQHTPMSLDRLGSLIDGLLPTDSQIIVRAVWNDTWIVNTMMDIGADGVIVPLTNTAEEVESAVAAAKYPPDGVRSWGPRRTERYGGPQEYGVRANHETMVLPQIESLKAVENIDAILEVKGIDGIMIGPNDLALSMGLGEQRTGPEHDEMLAHILSKCKEHGVPWGMFTQTLENADKWLTRGGQIAIVGGDLGFVTAGATETARQCKELQARL